MSLTTNFRRSSCIAVCLLTFGCASVSANSNRQNPKAINSNTPNLVAQNINPQIAGDPNLFGTWFYVESSYTVNGSGVYQEKMKFLPNGELHIYDTVTMVNGYKHGNSKLVIDKGQWAVQNRVIYTRRSNREPWQAIVSRYGIHHGDLIAIATDGNSRRRWTRN